MWRYRKKNNSPCPNMPANWEGWHKTDKYTTVWFQLWQNGVRHLWPHKGGGLNWGVRRRRLPQTSYIRTVSLKKGTKGKGALRGENSVWQIGSCGTKWQIWGASASAWLHNRLKWGQGQVGLRSWWALYIMLKIFLYFIFYQKIMGRYW